ncbi:hypothetical protein P4631_17550 [Halalkalibacterium halodurans]|uniref:hypothetical protein n=1 Tax=Halalkalibacterium halodurans TaxID=86665 RepID=UPI002E1AFA1F|nr:hypothetical protein [Halalkalibacterium halodurans]
MSRQDVKRTPDQLIQVKQKLLYYQSEFKRINRVNEQQAEKLVEQKQTIASLLEKVQQLQEVNEAASTNEPSLTDNKPSPPAQLDAPEQTAIDAFFNYTMILPNMKSVDEQVIIKGNFLIHNRRQEPLKSPVICLAFNKPGIASLSGKLVLSSQRQLDEVIIDDERLEEQWGYAQKDGYKHVRRTGEHWLKPLHTNEIGANDTLSFSQFEVAIPLEKEATLVTLDGFVYGEGLEEGMAAKNKVMIQVP